VQQKSSPVIRGRPCKLTTPNPYGFGEEVVVVEVSVLLPLLGEEPVLMVVLVSVLFEGAGDSFTTVVLFSVLFSAGGFTVVSFCSQAASDAAAARTQMYFVIIYLDDGCSALINRNCYGEGDGEVVVVVVVVSVPAGLDVVVVSDEVAPLGLAAGVTVSFFCSQAAIKAAPARMQIYFFISGVENRTVG
jgi:hypothetical protein